VAATPSPRWFSHSTYLTGHIKLILRARLLSGSGPYAVVNPEGVGLRRPSMVQQRVREFLRGFQGFRKRYIAQPRQLRPQRR